MHASEQPTLSETFTCHGLFGGTETVPTIGSGLYPARTDPASLYAVVQRFRDSFLVEAAELWDESRSSMNYAAAGLTW